MRHFIDSYEVEMGQEDGEITASIPVLRGCVASGRTVEDTLRILANVKQVWIEIALERGWQIPEPPVSL